MSSTKEKDVCLANLKIIFAGQTKDSADKHRGPTSISLQSSLQKSMSDVGIGLRQLTVRNTPSFSSGTFLVFLYPIQVSYSSIWLFDIGFCKLSLHGSMLWPVCSLWDATVNS